MSRTPFKPGFSLTEVLMAAGILVVGFLLIAGTFPVGVKLTAVATERTIGMIASKEAMAKINLYGIDPAVVPYYSNTNPRFIVHVPYDGTSVYFYRRNINPAMVSYFMSESSYTNLRRIFLRSPSGLDIDLLTGNQAQILEALKQYIQCQSLYPSTSQFDYTMPSLSPGVSWIKTDSEDPPRYFWSALCRRLDSTSTEIQVTVFVSRMAGQYAQYPFYQYDRTTGIPVASPWTSSDYPTPVPMEVQAVAGSQIVYVEKDATSTYYYPKLSLTPDNPGQAAYISRGAILLDDRYGRLMRVQDIRYPDPAKPGDLGDITLFRPLDSDGIPSTVIPSDGDGLLMRPKAVATLGYRCWIWVVPPAMAGGASDPPSATPPKVIGRNPCVGVYQGQL